MYWYYKYPLLLAIAALTGTAVYWGWHACGVRKERVGRSSGAPMGVVAAPPAKAPVTGSASLSSPLPTVASEVKAAAPPVVSPPPAPPAVSALVETAQVPRLSNAPAAPSEFARKMKLAEETFGKGNLAMARGMIENAMKLPEVKPYEASWFQAADLLGKINLTLATTTAPAPEKIRYEVKSGDTLIGIRNKFQTTIELIAKANKLDMANPVIRAGMVLSIYPANWSIEVSKSRFLLLVRNNGKLFCYYRIGTGRENRTPVGTFKVMNRMREPEWSPPGRTPVPFGSPENVLGTRWLGLSPIEGTDPTLKGFGIHGTWQPDSIGTAASEGCVRMKNDEVNELYDLIPTGTRVTIKDEPACL